MDPSNWLPFYPDVLPARRSQQARPVSQPSYATAVFPVPDILATRTFTPTYPDSVPHRRTWTDTTRQVLIGPLVHPGSWRPCYPDLVPRLRVPRWYPSTPTTPSPALVIIGQLMAWAPRLPLVLRYRPGTPLPAGVWPLTPSLYSAPCVDLALDAFGMPSLTAQACTAPCLLAQGLAAPSLLDEDLC